MANSPVDTDPKQMLQEFGTRVLITSKAADRYLRDLEAPEKTGYEEVKLEKYTRFCGGVGGWSDYTERWH